LNEGVTEVTRDEFVKVIVHWITQHDMQKIAASIGFRLPRFFKKNMGDFQYELMCLLVAIASTATKNYLSDKPNLSKRIIDEVFYLLYDLSFPSSSVNYDSNKLPWIIYTQQKCDDYIEKCKHWDSNSIPSMASLFIKSLKKISNPLEAHVFLTTYIYAHLDSLSGALDSYRIINAKNEEIFASHKFDYDIDDDDTNDETYDVDD
jgi:hypothetical protein